MVHQKLVNLHTNLVVKGYIDKAEENLYNSARDYYHDKNCGLLEIKFISEWEEMLYVVQRLTGN